MHNVYYSLVVLQFLPVAMYKLSLFKNHTTCLVEGGVTNILCSLHARGPQNETDFFLLLCMERIEICFVFCVGYLVSEMENCVTLTVNILQKCGEI